MVFLSFSQNIWISLSTALRPLVSSLTPWRRVAGSERHVVNRTALGLRDSRLKIFYKGDCYTSIPRRVAQIINCFIRVRLRQKKIKLSSKEGSKWSKPKCYR